MKKVLKVPHKVQYQCCTLTTNFLFPDDMYEHLSSNHMYTDGSKSQDGVGLGEVYGNNLENHQ